MLQFDFYLLGDSEPEYRRLVNQVGLISATRAGSSSRTSSSRPGVGRNEGARAIEKGRDTVILSNIDIVRNIYAAWPKGLDAFLDALAPDIEWRFADNFVYGRVNPLIGHEALRQGSLKSLKADWDGFDGELDELLDAGDTIIGLGHYVGTYKATGRYLRAQFAHLWTLRNGKVIRWRQYVDTKQFADATGLEP